MRREVGEGLVGQVIVVKRVSRVSDSVREAKKSYSREEKSEYEKDSGREEK